MEIEKFEIKTVKETDPSIFDQKVNSLIADGYWLTKSRVLSNEDEIYFIAFLDKKYYSEEKEVDEIEPAEKKDRSQSSEISHL